ncbi:MAG TPA: cytochrome c oxidase assembly protein [Caldimonas sp.]|nr:cytochrome c oxidase assembly protein [Caldimonas sp.]
MLLKLGVAGRRITAAAAVVAASALVPIVDAHPLAAIAASPPTLGWSFEPWVIGCLLLSAGLYGLGLARLWRRAGPGRGIHARRALAFVGGWLATALALVSPLDALGNHLFSAHMVQHEVLMVVAAPLFVLGRPLGAWAWALPIGWRRAIGHFFHRPGWRAPWLIVTAPLAAWLLHAIVLWLWHVPALFEAALASPGVHTLQHTSFMLAALVYWWSVAGLGASGRHRGTAMLSLFTTMIHTGALGALLTLSPVAWYAAYAGRTAAFGLDPLEDQQLGGLVMWIPAGFAYVACGLATATHWLRRPASDQAARPLGSAS